ncbi:hypothetical protein DSO06_05770 [Candidatus Nezhaarchaeota archaeon WYZ-LMO8]|nr:MAG: hypothetical protein DSO06_05770 [Candidatus Nezhaarchaeota archaeon WYZ-LMO8]TDA36205.1 MAG: hypothetical protein DSO05_04020 [Candidatus Nezhaarchaeota archaeon WYZ-LMO7]
MNEVAMTRRKSFFDEINEMFERFKKLFEEHEDTSGLESFKQSSSTMYSITVTYDNYGRPIVKVSAQGGVDRSQIERHIKEKYPNAKIVWEGESYRSHIKPIEESHVREVSIEEQSDLKQTRRPRGAEIIELDSKKPRIYEVKIEDEGENKKRRKWYDIKVD